MCQSKHDEHQINNLSLFGAESDFSSPNVLVKSDAGGHPNSWRALVEEMGWLVPWYCPLCCHEAKQHGTSVHHPQPRTSKLWKLGQTNQPYTAGFFSTQHRHFWVCRHFWPLQTPLVWTLTSIFAHGFVGGYNLQPWSFCWVSEPCLTKKDWAKRWISSARGSTLQWRSFKLNDNVAHLPERFPAAWSVRSSPIAPAMPLQKVHDFAGTLQFFLLLCYSVHFLFTVFFTMAISFALYFF